ncbi:hypothetical protein [Niabella hibiscisoli]|uniref:hypothetical protein n=1 Tax=Niabella hibiscisoli TaxID=1825928 RepID=UPI001F1186C5|nr:hypothetical protein [Niabella hibiscisoli]MCH5716689.1 hypothetical protein [Niabella hibiscisoli]
MTADSKDSSISFYELEQAYKIAARIVAVFGDAYLPSFQRLHEEVQKRNKQQSLKSIALDIANKSRAFDN